MNHAADLRIPSTGVYTRTTERQCVLATSGFDSESMDKQLLANPQAEFVCMLVERLEKLERKLDASEETDVIWSCFEQAQQQADHALKVRIQEAIKPVLVSHPSHFICVFPFFVD